MHYVEVPFVCLPATTLQNLFKFCVEFLDLQTSRSANFIFARSDLVQASTAHVAEIEFHQFCPKAAGTYCKVARPVLYET
jgi:hypothetical protein